MHTGHRPSTLDTPWGAAATLTKSAADLIVVSNCCAEVRSTYSS